MRSVGYDWWRACLLAIALLAALDCCGRADDDSSAIKALIPWLLADDASFKSVLFADVIAATCGKKILPWDGADPESQRIASRIAVALNLVLEKMNDPANAASAVRRINEVSSYFEQAIRDALDADPEFRCDFPRTAAGKVQRAGYPDLRLQDKPTGRICYLDPKLYAKGSRASTFRTFYFEPKKDTNKVLDDAHHFIVGIEHDPKAASRKFVRWELIDLSTFRVKLKAEFEGSNRDLYRAGTVVKSGVAK